MAGINGVGFFGGVLMGMVLLPELSVEGAVLDGLGRDERREHHPARFRRPERQHVVVYLTQGPFPLSLAAFSPVAPHCAALLPRHENGVPITSRKRVLHHLSGAEPPQVA